MNDYQENYQYTDFQGDSHALDSLCPFCLVPYDEIGICPKCHYVKEKNER